MSLKEKASFELAGGVSLHISIYARPEEVVCGSLKLGSWTTGEKIAFFCADPDRVWIDEDRSVWFGHVSVEMPWHELVKLADFLQLDIPQPELPAGQEVPR